MSASLLPVAAVAALLLSLGACSPEIYCHPGLVQEDGAGIYFKRDADGGGRYFNRDGGGRLFHRDESDGKQQGICRSGVFYRELPEDEPDQSQQ